MHCSDLARAWPSSRLEVPKVDEDGTDAVEAVILIVDRGEEASTIEAVGSRIERFDLGGGPIGLGDWSGIDVRDGGFKVEDGDEVEGLWRGSGEEGSRGRWWVVATPISLRFKPTGGWAKVARNKTEQILQHYLQ